MSSQQQICPWCGFEFSADEGPVGSAGKFCPRCQTQIDLPGAQTTEGSVSSDPAVSCHLLKDGAIFDKYRIIGFIGSGGMSEVYKAEHLLLKQIFALKVMKSSGSEKESSCSRRFLREAKCFHQLEHPNIVRIFEIGCEKNSGMLYISMEYLSGGTLSDVKDRRFSEEEILQIASEMALALEELEKHGMVHRDIKPSNIMRDDQGRCKLMDMGIAMDRRENCAGSVLTVDRCMIGTPAYASSEQCRTPHSVDIRSDIYSLGVTLYQLASGVVPYLGKTPLETVLNVIHKEPIPLEKLPTGLSRECMALISCMMSKSPEKRPRNAARLKQMIREIREGRSRKKEFFFFLLKTFGAVSGILLLAAGAAAGGFFLRNSRIVAPSQPPSDGVIETAGPEAVTPEPEKQRPFLQGDFISTGRKRTLTVRLEEFRQILAFLNSPRAAALPFRRERIQFFSTCKQNLEQIIKRKNTRKARRSRQGPSLELRTAVENFLKKKRVPFSHSPEGIRLVNRLTGALQAGNLDPDVSFSDGSGHKRSLTGLALAGLLPLQEPLLKKLIFAGADIEAGHGPALKYPVNMRIQHIRGRLTGIMAFNGADNVDIKDGSSMLLSVLDPAQTYLVCRPSGNYLDWPLADFLVSSGARLDVENKKGQTPVHLAALHNRSDLLEKLLLAGAPGGDVRDQDGNTPFMLAVQNHATAAVKVLTRFGMTSPVTEKDRAQGALIYGITNNEPLQVEQALDLGASMTFLYANKLNALQNAVVFRRGDLVKFLLDRGALPSQNGEMISLPGIAICIGSPEIFKLLLEKSSFENMVIIRERFRAWLPDSVLSHYRRRGDLAAKFFDVMLKHQWDINKEGPHGFNILERALCSRHIAPEVIRLLLDRGADPAAVVERKKISLSKVPPYLRRLITEAVRGKNSEKKSSR